MCQGIIACSLCVISLFGSQNSAITSSLIESDLFRLLSEGDDVVASCFFLISSIGMAAEIQPPDWLRGQVLLLPHVPRRGLNGVETVLRSGSFKQVRPLLKVTNSITSYQNERKSIKWDGKCSTSL